MSSRDWAIDLHGVSKTFSQKIHALRDVDIRVGGGEIFGLLGPNGAGKSTLIKIMITAVLPDQAGGTILGQPLGHRPTLRRIGYLPEGHRFPPYLTGQQFLDFCARLSGMPRRQRQQQAALWLARMGLTKWAHTRISRYSKGMLQRVGVAQALLHGPDVVLLDEPTDGVDPLGRRDIREILTELRSAGKTIFINSHILSELEMICDRVSILMDGQVTRQGTISELTAHSVTYELTTAQSVEACRQELERLEARVDGQRISVRGHDAQAVNLIIDLLRRQDILIESVQPKRWSLEDVLIDATRLPDKD